PTRPRGPKSNSAGGCGRLKWPTGAGRRSAFMNPPRPFMARKSIAIALLALAGLAVVACSAWGAGLVYFAGPGGAQLRVALAAGAALAGVATLAALFFRGWRRPALLLFVALQLAL